MTTAEMLAPSQALSLPIARSETVLIDVSQDDNGNYALTVFPQRADDTTIYHQHGNKVSKLKPLQVLWVVQGLSQYQRIHIEAKPGAEAGGPIMSGPYDIAHPDNAILSGSPARGPGVGTGKAGRLPWDYNVTLYDDQQNTVLATLDPSVIIKEDP